MNSAVWGNVITLLGTLSGGVLIGALQARVARTARQEAQAASQRTDALTAVTMLLAAVADHRRARWVREELRLSGSTDEQAVLRARDAAHATRSAITAPLARVAILLPDLAELAEAAVQATYAMRETVDHAALEALRAGSVAAEKQLRQAAARVFAAGGGR